MCMDKLPGVMGGAAFIHGAAEARLIDWRRPTEEPDLVGWRLRPTLMHTQCAQILVSLRHEKGCYSTTVVGIMSSNVVYFVTKLVCCVHFSTLSKIEKRTFLLTRRLSAGTVSSPRGDSRGTTSPRLMQCLLTRPLTCSPLAQRPATSPSTLPITL